MSVLVARPASLLAIAVMIVSGLAAGPALAQDAAPADSAAPDEEIVITGTAGAGIRRQDAAFAVTNLDESAIDRIAPSSVADLFRVIPGVSAESSGGQNGANIFVRGYPSSGDAEFVTLQTQGVPFFPPPTLSFLENTQLIRIDETISRVEAVRGGTGALFSSGQPGLTVNFVQRQGGDAFEGLAKLSGTDFGEIRGDAWLSGPLGPDTGFMVGGYYAQSDGIRDPGFRAEQGGQLTANVRHKLDRGEILVFGRYLNDRGQWLLPIPVVQNGSKISAFPGFDAGTGALASRETRFATFNDGTRADLRDGRGADLYNLGLNADYELSDGLTLRNRTSWLDGDADTTGFVPAGAPQTATAFAAGLGGAIGSLSFVDGGAAVGGDQQVIQVGTWVVRKAISAFVNDASVEFKRGINTLTVGGFYARSKSRDRWNLGNGRLITAEENGRRLNLVLADGRQASRDGFVQGSTFNVDADYAATDFAFYAVDELQITPELRLDAGIRWQRHEVDGTVENNDFGVDTDGNPLTLFNNNSAVLNGSFTDIRYRGDEFSWTAAANYDFTREIGAFFRYSRGNSFPFFDNLRDGLDSAPQVDSYELGLKASTGIVSVYATVFHNVFEGLTSVQILDDGSRLSQVGGAKTTGVELEGTIRPFDGAALGFGGTYLDAKYEDFFTGGGAIDNSGNRVQRQPEWQWRLNPSYEVPFGAASKAVVYATVGYTGNRFSDPENNQLLPKYYKVDAGVIVDVNAAIQLQVSGDNLTDKIGLTEGNPRLIGAQGAGVILARPILGRSFRFSAAYKF